MSNKLAMPGEKHQTEKRPGHWLLAQIGKTVLRPGGLELTNKMLTQLSINTSDDVIEFAPGVGLTAQMTLAKRPKTYTAVEQNEQAAKIVRSYLNGNNQTCHVNSAQDTALDSEIASVVYCEAMLTMQSSARKKQIIKEAYRLLKTNGRFGIHEMCITPNDIDSNKQHEIQKALTETIQHPAKPLTLNEWKLLIQECGFEIEYEAMAPMHLLEPSRLLQDEGLNGFLKIIKNLILKPDIRKRVLKMKSVFREHSHNLAAITLVVKKKEQACPYLITKN
ncbi:SAM-dependent methyltransferase [Photobacterium kishitanii]|uniref:methyltransferase domain-containing protein n=1 Tax=Photobacterium kishitanii TaxID=318456 RepID=UPI000D15DAF7|nr:methyltransferase domain-containing protein [Photobacterium kishitanii]PSW60386.1 SAM-dependent methyltransferase [Photobacterium kishitanii]